MVETDHVEQFAGPAHPIDPPIEAAFPEHLPPIQRIAPALAGRAEIIRRHPRHADRLALLIQLKQLRVRPHVRRIIGNKDGDVAHQLDAALGAVSAQVQPLIIKRELDRFFHLQRFGILLAELRKRRGIAVGQRTRPIGPYSICMLLTQNNKRNIVVEPRSLLAAKLLKTRPLSVLVLCQKVCSSLMQQRQFLLLHLVEVDGGRRPRQAELIAIEPAPIGQHVQAYQERVSRGGR